MSGIQTNWVLKLVDKISDPIKNITNSTNKFNSNLDDAEQKVNFTGDALKEAFQNNTKYVKDVSKELKTAERELKKLNNVANNAKAGTKRQQAIRDYQQQKQKVEALRVKLQGAESDLRDITKQTNKAAKATQRWDGVMLGVNQSLEVIDKLSNSLDFATEIQNLTSQTQRMTDLSGAALDKYVSKSREIGDVYDEDAEKVARTANVLTKQLGGSYEENFKLIEEGFKRGANINGDFLDQLLEYPTQMRETGIAATEMVAIIAKANKDGGFSDKAIDSIKEGGLAIREMGQTQIDALGGIGIKTKDLKDKTSWEALQIVIKAMQDKNLSTQAKQLALTDIFKGAGEDSGQALIQALAKEMPKLEELPEVEQAGAGIKGFFSRLSTQIGQKLGVFAIYAQQFAPVVQLTASAIPVMQSLGVATKAQTAAQWMLNIAMDANPIGLIIIAIAALVAYIGIAINYYDDFGAAMLQLLGPIGTLINAFISIYNHWDSIVKAFKDDGILGGLKRIGVVLLDSVMRPLEQILSLAAAIDPTGLAQKGLEAVKSFREDNNLVTDSEKELAEKKKKEDEQFSVAKYVNGEVPKLSFNNKDKKEKGRKRKVGDGLNISGKGGSKVITMNLDVKNYFNTRGSSNRDMADEIVGMINDRLKDSLVTIN